MPLYVIRKLSIAGACFCALATAAVTTFAYTPVVNWPNAFQINSASDSNNFANAIKTPTLIANKAGGFSLTYNVSNSIKYRQMSTAGVLDPIRTVMSGTFSPNPWQMETAGGRAVVTWENWVGGPDAGVTSSTDNINFAAPVERSTTDNAKWPMVATYGTAANNNNTLMTYWNSNSTELRYNYFNGTSWSGDLGTGFSASNEYGVTGIATNPTDGSVWRMFSVKTGSSPNRYDIRTIRFDPNSLTWGNQTTIVSSVTYFPSRFSMDFSTSGKAMAVWDSGESTTAKIWSGGSWGAAIGAYDSSSFFGNVAADPSNPDDFYIFNCYDTDFMAMRPIINGTMMPLEYMGGNVPNSQVLSARGDILPDGTMAVTWENWDNLGHNPLAYAAIRPAQAVPEPATLALAALGFFGLAAARSKFHKNRAA